MRLEIKVTFPMMSPEAALIGAASGGGRGGAELKSSQCQPAGRDDGHLDGADDQHRANLINR